MDAWRKLYALHWLQTVVAPELGRVRPCDASLADATLADTRHVDGGEEGVNSCPGKLLELEHQAQEGAGLAACGHQVNASRDGQVGQRGGAGEEQLQRWGGWVVVKRWGKNKPLEETTQGKSLSKATQMSAPGCWR